ncbi:hypothetical protein N9Q05_02175, partial [bacterium]|nr:hypothetical protein [bacterium]
EEQRKLGFPNGIPHPNHMFRQFVDAITSSRCMPWLTVNFERQGDLCEKLSEKDVSYLIQALEQQNYSMGLFIYMGASGTLDQRCKLIKLCERAIKKGGLFLQSETSSNEQLCLSQKEREFLMIRTQDILQQINIEKCNLARTKIDDHINQLEKEKSLVNSKANRIPALSVLREQFSKALLTNQKMSDILGEWEKQPSPTSPKGCTHLKTLSNTRRLSLFPRTTSSEILVEDLKLLDTPETAQTKTRS